MLLPGSQITQHTKLDQHLPVHQSWRVGSALPYSRASGNSSGSSRCRCRCRGVVCRAASSPAHTAAAVDTEPLVERTFEHNWRTSLTGHDNPDPRCRPVLALGKFDALHKGHQALAAAALQLGGRPVLLSFSGMAAVLGWPHRKPLVAPCDRARVLHLWAMQLAEQQQEQLQRRLTHKCSLRTDRSEGDVPGSFSVGSSNGSSSSTHSHLQDHHQQQQHGPQQQLQHSMQQQLKQQQRQHQEQLVVMPVRQRYIPFAAVRSMSPETFVDVIVKDFKAAGVVAGGNYRFGYRAAGDTALLQQLCEAANVPAAIVELVGAAEPGAVGPVSSTKIREMLACCRVQAVRRALGRPYRLVAEVSILDWQQQQQQGHDSSLKLQQQRSRSSHSFSSDSSSSSSNASSRLQPSQQSAGSAGSSDSGGDTVTADGGSAAAPGSGRWYYPQVFVPTSSLLNQQPAPGVYLCNLQLLIGATAHDDLLTLQQTFTTAASGATSHSSSTQGAVAGGNGSSLQVLRADSSRSRGSSRCCCCILAVQQEVHVVPDGVLLPKLLWEAVEGCLPASQGSSSSSQTSSSSSSYSTSSSSSRARCRSQPSDPTCWDTDDNDDVGTEEDNTSSSSSMAGENNWPHALLVLDFESCLLQLCEMR